MASLTYRALCGGTSLLCLAVCSCDDYNDQFEGLDELVDAAQQDVKSLDLALTADDYTAIGKLKLEEGDVSKLGTTQAFASHDLAVAALAKYLGTKYPTADAGSSINVDYTIVATPSEVAAAVSAAKPLTLSSSAYAAAWPEDNAQECLTPATVSKLPEVVASANAEAQEGDMVMVEYKYSATEPAVEEDVPGATSNTFALLTIPTLPTVDSWDYIPSGNVDLSSYKGKKIRLGLRYVSTTEVAGTVEAKNLQVGEIVSDANNGVYYTNDLLTGSGDEGKGLPAGWTSVDVTVDGVETVWSYAGSKYGVKATASKKVDGVQTNYATEGWLLSPEIDLTSATSPVLNVEVAANFFSGATLTDHFGLYASTNYEAGNTKIVVGKNKGLRSAALTTEKRLALFQLTGGKWKERKDARVVQPSEFAEMGISRANFSSTLLPGDYLPQYLSLKLPYAAADDQVVVAYQFYNTSTKETSVVADDYAFVEGAWGRVGTAAESSHFVLNSEGWTYDPSVVITIPADKSATSAAFYQTVVDLVWETVDVSQLGATAKGQGYVTSYGNNEYYTGSSAYQTNFDWRPSSAKSQYAAGFEGKSDEEIVALLQQHTIELLPTALAKLYPEAKPVEGLDVFYTFNVVVYDGKASNWTIQFKVTSPGTFEYVAESLKKVE